MLAPVSRALRHFALSLTVLVSITACGGKDASSSFPTVPTPPTPALTGATASASSLTLISGQSGALTITATVAAGATTTFALSSSNAAVATVSGSAGQYTITAVGAGSATLTATVTASGTALITTRSTVVVPVTVVPPVVVALTPSTLSVRAGESGVLTVGITGGAPVPAAQACVSNNAAVATATLIGATCAITAVSAGVATITATASTGQSAQSTVTVLAPVMVMLTPSVLTLRPNATGVLTIAISGGAPLPSAERCASSNVAVATTTLNGSTCNVTAVGAGSATITATTVTGQTAQSSVSVAAEPAITAIAVAPPSASLTIGQQVTLVPTVTRASAAVGITYDYRTASSAVASVGTGGLVTALSAGTTDITVTARGSGGGFVTTELTGTVRVTVAPAASTLTIEPGTLSLPRGLSAQATAVLRNAGGNVVTGQAVQWSSSDTSVARVDMNGLVASGRPGIAVLEATSAGIRGTATVSVSAPPPNAACRLPSRTGSVSFGFPRSTTRLRPTGTVRATVLFVDFSDAPATRTPENVLNIIQPASGAYFSAQSYGAMSLVLEPQRRWLRMSKPSTQYGWPNNVTFAAQRALLQEAADLAAPFTDMTAADLLVVMTNPDAGAITFGPALVPNPGDGIRVPGRSTTIDNATNSGRDLSGWGGLWLSHEMGHLLSLPDLYDFAPPTPAQTNLHVGEWSIMGLISGRGAELTAFERWQLGWLADEQLVCAPVAATSLVVLSPIAQLGGTKAVLVPLTATSALVVESRRALGYDARLTQTGALVYLIDTQVANGRGTMRILPVDDADQSKLTRVLTPGQSVNIGGSSITLVSRTDGADVVRVVRP